MPFSELKVTVNMDEVGRSDGVILPYEDILVLSKDSPSKHIVFNCSLNVLENRILNLELDGIDKDSFKL